MIGHTVLNKIGIIHNIMFILKNQISDILFYYPPVKYHCFFFFLRVGLFLFIFSIVCR